MNQYQELFNYLSKELDAQPFVTQMQEIIDISVKIHEIQQQEEFEAKTRAAIDESGGCSVCGDLDGYSCTCEEEDYDEELPI